MNDCCGYFPKCNCPALLARLAEAEKTVSFVEDKRLKAQETAAGQQARAEAAESKLAAMTAELERVNRVHVESCEAFEVLDKMADGYQAELANLREPVGDEEEREALAAIRKLDFSDSQVDDIERSLRAKTASLREAEAKIEKIVASHHGCNAKIAALEKREADRRQGEK